MKTYSIQYGIGTAKYLVTHHDGVKTHRDGSKFFDCTIFKNKKKLAAFVRTLRSNGYVKS